MSHPTDRDLDRPPKKMGSFQSYQTSFGYSHHQTGEERFVGAPEQGSRDLIPLNPLVPGTTDTAGVTSDATVGHYRVEVSVANGAGTLKPSGGITGAMEEAMNGAKRALLRIENKRSLLDVSGDVVEHVDPIFYGDPRTVAMKALRLG